MQNDQDDYDVFLQTWKPSAQLDQATLPQYLFDPVLRNRVLSDQSGDAAAKRTDYVKGKKTLDSGEQRARAYDFFCEKQSEWAAEFCDYLLSGGVPTTKIDVYINSFVSHWVDGKKRRQDSPEMLSIKASIRDFDRHHAKDSARFVANPVDESTEALFLPDEMRVVFDANNGLISSFLPDYIEALGEEQLVASLDDLHARRGVYMPALADNIRRELNYLSSYSLALGPVEQFAQTFTSDTKTKGIAMIFSAPITTLQDRVVAFAPFVCGMDISQLELVIAPPVSPSILQDNGVHGGIHEYSFT
tara:strand:+ start:1757 stop:2665 length:909 start_codon:yes stop_codon:yes gene_type:complete